MDDKTLADILSIVRLYSLRKIDEVDKKISKKQILTQNELRFRQGYLNLVGIIESLYPPEDEHFMEDYDHV